jgi:acetylornithine deacetylase
VIGMVGGAVAGRVEYLLATSMDPLPLLRDLVATNSVNPSLAAGAPGEQEAAELVRAALERAGLDAVVQEAAPGRPNVVGVLDGREAGPAVMFCGHLDTVGVEGMTNPFTPVERSGRLYGRGAQDMKGGVAAMVAAAAILAASWTRGRLIVAGVADEEHLSLGAEALVRDWRADMAIVTEPTDLQLAVGHKGFAWIEVVAYGRAAHGSRPSEGVDAIARMGRVLVSLEAFDRELQERPPVPFQGTGSLHASTISGGRELSVYPDACRLRLERRTVADEDGTTVLGEVEALLEAHRRRDPAFRADARLLASRPPYGLDPAHALPSALGAALSRAELSPAPTGMTFWTDAAVLGAAGIPSVLFGPGGAGLHSAEEYVHLADVVTCRDVLVNATRIIVHGA